MDATDVYGSRTKDAINLKLERRDATNELRAVDHGRGSLERKRKRVQIFLFGMMNLSTEKKNMVHVCFGVCFSMERTVRRDSVVKFARRAGRQL